MLNFLKNLGNVFAHAMDDVDHEKYSPLLTRSYAQKSSPIFFWGNK